MGKLYKFCGNGGKARCIIGLGEWTPLHMLWARLELSETNWGRVEKFLYVRMCWVGQLNPPKVIFMNLLRLKWEPSQFKPFCGHFYGYGGVYYYYYYC